MSQLQVEIDKFLRASRLVSVIDAIFFPGEQAIVVIRKLGHKNVTVDISEADTPDKAIEILKSNAAGY